jgi:hypothetical protein
MHLSTAFVRARGGNQLSENTTLMRARSLRRRMSELHVLQIVLDDGVRGGAKGGSNNRSRRQSRPRRGAGVLPARQGSGRGCPVPVRLYFLRGASLDSMS